MPRARLVCILCGGVAGVLVLVSLVLLLGYNVRLTTRTTALDPPVTVSTPKSWSSSWRHSRSRVLPHWDASSLDGYCALSALSPTQDYLLAWDRPPPVGPARLDYSADYLVLYPAWAQNYDYEPPLPEPEFPFGPGLLAACSRAPGCSAVTSLGHYKALGSLDAMPWAVTPPVQLIWPLTPLTWSVTAFVRASSPAVPHILAGLESSCSAWNNMSSIQRAPEIAFVEASLAMGRVSGSDRPLQHLVDAIDRAVSAERARVRSLLPGPTNLLELREAVGVSTRDSLVRFSLTVSGRESQLRGWLAAFTRVRDGLDPVSRARVSVCIAVFGGTELDLDALAAADGVVVVDLRRLAFWKTRGQRECMDAHTAAAAAAGIPASSVAVAHADVDVYPTRSLVLEAFALLELPVPVALLPVSDVVVHLASSPGLVLARASSVALAGGYREEAFKSYNCEDVDLLYRLLMAEVPVVRTTIPGLYHEPHPRAGGWYTADNHTSADACQAQYRTIFMHYVHLDVIRLCVLVTDSACAA